MKLKIAAVVALATWIVACASSPTGRSQLITVSDSEVDRMGGQAYEQIKAETPLSRNRQQVQMINCITSALVEVLDEPHMPDTWEVTLFADEQVNAFALPGGYIGVFEGLIEVAEHNQHQVAAVIGHEIAHVTARHAAERVSRHQATGFAVNVLGSASGSQATAALLGVGAQVGVLLPFNRAQETEADVLGLDYMARAGFDPNASVDLWRNMNAAAGRGGPPALLSTHPSGDNRIRDLQRRMPRALELYEEARAAGRQPDCTA